ncbi:nicotinamidase [Listeria monocytogenes]|nr:nicotinamidase [Listeria monocytogenes]ECW3435066.1 nicotinamidase [Listeria monocytogenes]
MKIAAFDIDAQKGFTPLCPDELPVSGGDKIVPELNFMASLASLRIGSKDAHPQNAVWVVDSKDEMLAELEYPNADRTWVRHCEPGTKGFELLDGLPVVTDYDYFIWKGMEPDIHPYGACYHDIVEHLSTGVLEYLREQKVDLVLVGGLAFDFCVKTTVIQLSRAGFSVLVYLPATRALSEQGFDETKERLANTEKVQLIETREELVAYCQ